MSIAIRVTTGVLMVYGLDVAVATAQTPSGPQSGSADPAPVERDEQYRPATTTFFGDTGLWYVPTAEVLASGNWSVSGYRRGINYVQGYSNVADFAGTFGIGINDRAELFGAFLVDTRIDRDIRPLFIPDAGTGGIIDRYPRMNRYWSDDNVGDLYLGTKLNLWSEYRQDAAAVAFRAMVKLPTGDPDKGVGTGKADGILDLIVSKEIGGAADVAGYAGWEVRGKPDGFDTPNGAFRWGGGAAFPSRSPLRVFTELHGTIPSKDSAAVTGAPLISIDGSVAPATSMVEQSTKLTTGLTLQFSKGFFVGTAVTGSLPLIDRTHGADSRPSQFADHWDWQVRIGWHPGSRTAAGRPATQTAAPVPPTVANRPPMVTAQCDPCTVEVGRNSTVTADASDPDGDALTYRWTAPTGMLVNPAERQTVWTAPQQEGSVPVTVTVDDAKGGMASATVNIQVVRPSARTYTFEDVHFDFDRYTLRPDATRLLDEAVTAMRNDATLRLTIEGHTCNIGTAEYNLALGDRRANAVKNYLVSRGVIADRLNTISYGEEQPLHDNLREETRRLNRRAALVVRLQP
jgi:outer membrane protein OmpA-like peptidoglycan-associated protein